jgi:cobalt-zinc-cadmium resistance protein CzcA
LINRFVRICLQRRWLVVAIFILIAAFGYYSFTTLNIEAYPDIADTTSQVVTQYPGHAAEEVEEQVTIPLERELIGIPGLAIMRSKSTFGLSLIVLVFRDGIEDYWSRTRIRERVGDVTLPSGVQPTLDPLTSPIGEIYRYTLEGPGRSSRELRELQEWVVIPTLKQVFGIADVTNFGGERTQFQILLDPSKLRSYNLSLQQVDSAVSSNNANAGGSVLIRGDQAAVVRGIGLIRSLDDLGHVVVDSRKGTPIFVRDLGRLQLGALTRDGIAGKNDQADVVSGIVLLLRGENPSVVLKGIHEKVRQLNAGLLPADVKVVPYIDRTDLVQSTLHTVSHTLLEGMGLVIIILILFLGRPRSALIVAATIPLALLIAFILMAFTKIPANLLSLGAIDFGIIVDGSIVVLENILRLREKTPSEPLSEEVAADAATQVARPMFFATAIIITAYLPLFAFQRVEKKLFSPMAYTVGYALIGAILVALALTPGLALAAFRKPRKPYQNPVLRWLTPRYEHLLRHLIERPSHALVPAAGAAILALVLAATVGREFLPYLDEGSLWLQIELPPGISLQKASDFAGEIRRATLREPQVESIVTQTGRNDDGTDPWTPSHIEAAVTLKPYSTWPRGMRKNDLIQKLSARYSEIPGITVGFSQPMIDGVNDKIAGAHSDLVVKVFGKDFAGMRKVAEQLADLLSKIPGAVDVAVDQEPPLPQLQIEVDRDAAARYGVNVSAISDLIEIGIGGRPIGQVFQGERLYDVTTRYIESVRSSPDAIGNLALTTPSGAQVPLSSVASIALRTGESTITREMNRRHMTVKLDLRNRDLSSFLKEAHRRIDQDLKYDRQAYEIEWGGQFENQRRAQARLAVIVPAALGLIFLLLYGAFGTLRHATVILVSVPLALLGGMIALHLRGMTLNVSSSVGFIALFGVAVQNGVIMVTQLNRRRDQRVLELSDAVVQGAKQRLRPVLMTATVAILGLLPASLARGIGSDVQRPLATVVVGGLTTATILTLLVLPVIYLLAERRFGPHHAVPSETEPRK